MINEVIQQENLLVNCKTAAKLCNISPSRLYELINDGTIPVTGLQKRNRLIRMDDLRKAVLDAKTIRKVKRVQPATDKL